MDKFIGHAMRKGIYSHKTPANVLKFLHGLDVNQGEHWLQVPAEKIADLFKLRGTIKGTYLVPKDVPSP